MSYTYTWSNEEQTMLKREDEQGNVTWIPTDPANTSYAEFLASGATAEPYVAPPAPKTLTTEEKVNHLLSDYGLTRSELLTALEAKPAVQQAKPQLDLTGADDLLKLDTRALMDLARQHSIHVDESLLKPENHDALANFMAASLNLLGQ